ncbi:MAG: TorF family putative porin [Pseudomonadales bacterium]
MRNRFAAVTAAALMLSGTVAAQELEVSANVTLASDYSLRGVSQTDRGPAIQGGFDVAFGSGFYVGTWASNVAFGITSMEWDLYLGYAGQITDDIGYDVSYFRFEYPEAGELDYNEFHASLAWRDFTFGLGYSPEYLALDSVTWWYPNVSYSLSLRNEWTLDVTLGYSILDDNSAQDWAALFGDDRVFDWSITYSVPVAGLDVGFGVVGTDIKKRDCFGGDKACQTRAVVSLSKAL